MKPKLTLALACLLATLGVAAGLFAFPARADNPAGATSLSDLQALGYGLGYSGSGATVCMEWVVMYGNGAPWTVIGEPDQTRPECATDPALIQQRIDDLIAAYPPLPQTTAAAPDPIPATTTAPVDAPPAAAPVSGGTQTVTVSDPTLQAQIDALNAKIDALTGRVDKLSTANAAAWDAFVAATGAGASAPDAALAARSGYLNSLYGL